MMKQPCQLADAGRDCPRGLRLLELPEDALVRVLLWARGSLRALSCSCRQLNYLARTRAPFWLRASRIPGQTPELARVLSNGGVPFSGCTRLDVLAKSGATYSLLPGILAAAARLPGLVELKLELALPAEEEGEARPQRREQVVHHNQQQQQQQEQQQQHAVAVAAEGGQQQEEDEQEHVQQQQQQEEEEEEGEEQDPAEWGAQVEWVDMESEEEAGGGDDAEAEEVVVRYTAAPDRYRDQDLIIAGPLHCLRWLPQLRRVDLRVEAFGTQAARALAAAAPQLTSLHLMGEGSASRQSLDTVMCHPPSDLSPLTALTNLKMLWVWDMLNTAPALLQHQHHSTAAPGSNATTASSSSSSNSSRTCVPSSLEYLELCKVAVPSDWLSHLAGCPGLQGLSLTFDNITGTDALPLADVATAALQHAPGLTSLGYCNMIAEDNQIGCCSDEHIEDLAEEVDVEKRRPRGDLLGLTALRSLEADGCAPLLLGAPEDWEGLVELKRLTDLAEVDIRSPPPPGLRPLALVNLYGVWLYVSGEAMCQVLQAAPKLETFHFKVRPPAVADTAPGQGGRGGPAAPGKPPPAPLTALTSLTGQYLALSPTAAASHFNAAFAVAGSCLLRLDLTWPPGGGGAGELPDLTPFTRLQELSFGGEALWLYVRREEYSRVGEEEVVAMLQPVSSSLKKLTLRWLPQLVPRCVVTLQAALPALVEFTGYNCYEVACDGDSDKDREVQRQQAAAAAAVQPLVRPGLEFCWCPADFLSCND